MKKFLILFLPIFLIFLAGCGETFDKNSEKNPAENKTVEQKNIPAEKNSDKKILVAYFSRTGENYEVGNISKGNTEIVAEMISEKVGGKLFEIKPAKNYPEDYRECTDLAKEEKEQNSRPEYVGEVENFSDYDVIFLGYPIWWSDLPMIVYTFLEKNNFSGKKIIPFCTSASETFIGKDFIEDSAKGSTVLEGLGVRGKRCQENPESVRQDVNEWLKNSGF